MKKVAVIGAGNWGKNLVKNFYEMGELECVAEMSANLRERLAGEYPKLKILDTYESLLLSEIKAVAIATPVPTHYEVAKRFLEAGKDVFVEKPMTLTTSEAQELCDVAEKNQRILMVGHLLLYQPAIQFIRNFLEAGKLGQIYHLHQERKKHGRARYVENVTWSLGVHDIAVLLYLVGESPKNITASGHCGLQKEVEDDVYVHMTFSNGAKAHLHNSWLWPENRRRLTIVGEKGMLVYDEVSGSVILHHKTIDHELNNQDLGSEVIFEASGQPLRLELDHFLDCVETRSQPISDGNNGYLVIDTLERIKML